MTNRIEKKFNQLKKEKKKALVTFITAGDPSPKICENILNDLPRNGVDMIEIGIPFSDPMADGPTIQRSSQRAISSGSNLKKTFVSGLHFLIPIFVLIYMLVYLRFTASYSIFYATVSLILVNLVYLLIKNSFSKDALKIWFNQTIVGF